MKLSLNTDFTALPRAGTVLRAGEASAVVPFDIIVLQHDERHLRRRVIELQHGDKVLVDLPEPVVLGSHDRLVLDDGRHVEIMAAAEDLYEIRALDAVHLAELCWHIGNRHLAAEIDVDRIMILKDHVIRDMLVGLGATVSDAHEPFHPVRGAYSGGHGDADHHHGHDHSDHQSHGHGHGDREPDRFGRLPGDPHYGHNHD